MDQLIHKFNLGPRLMEAKLFTIWDSAVGNGVARNAQPERLRGKTLHVVVSNSTWKQELSFMKGLIMEKLNSLIGHPVVNTISFRVGAIVRQIKEKKGASQEPMVAIEDSRLRAIEETLKDVTDLELKDVLTALRITAEKARHSKGTIRVK